MEPPPRPAFGPEHAEVYELTYRSRGKDWPGEARDVVRRVHRLLPEASSLLDVGCGTGAHLEVFAACFGHAEGLELSPAMLERAQRKLPDIRIRQGDMRRFDLGRSFDVVTCLFTAIAYLETLQDLRAAVRCMANHLVPGGVLVVEPWWLPEKYIEGYVGSDLARDGDRVVARVSHTRREGRAAQLQARWIVGDPSGLRAFATLESFTLFTRDEYAAAFDDARSAVEYHEGWLTGRGLFVGTRRP